MEVIKYREIYGATSDEIILYDTRNNVWIGDAKSNCWRKLLQFFKGVKRATYLSGRAPNDYSPFPPLGYYNVEYYE